MTINEAAKHPVGNTIDDVQNLANETEKNTGTDNVNLGDNIPDDDVFSTPKRADDGSGYSVAKKKF
ncbi:OLC1v1024917C1 [Oldenlandia corymbosa var. corymbosa]|uniref:OLC1v1024917C1 n=1 Tax=Oldenlandia corymbosa var. corymbosa TaxID=529605 RepID=A0AAV1C6I5_OLDCO|nr:OLC1v1024917C1 [Oldenlandia corymbosa var. corymbosa]